jgi:hypothetical protein
MDFERQARVGPQSFDLVGEKEEVFHIVAVCDIEVEPFGVGFNASDFGAQV